MKYITINRKIERKIKPKEPEKFYEKIKKYNKLIKQIHAPKISKIKRREMETIKQAAFNPRLNRVESNTFRIMKLKLILSSNFTKLLFV